MKVTLLFFANFKELLDCGREEIELDNNLSVKNLCDLLAERGDSWQQIFLSAEQSVKVSINQEMAEFDTLLNDNDEVAFFPPVTGG